MKKILESIGWVVAVIAVWVWLVFIALLPFAGIYWLINSVLLK